MKSKKTPKVVISNGHYKFILGTAAAELNSHGVLDLFITGGYPTGRFKKIVVFFKLKRFKLMNRFLRREELIPDGLIRTLWISELIIQFSAIVRKLTKTTKYSELIGDFGLRLYALNAVHHIKNSTGNIYHYRSGYGHESAKYAKEKGMLLICDHSIAHPGILNYLIENGGTLPNNDTACSMNKFWANVLRDLDYADYIIVNSNFVKSTFINQGWDGSKVFVIYNGVDDEFMSVIPSRITPRDQTKPVNFLFAGEAGPRKGFEILISAFLRINDVPWSLKIIGEIDPALDKEAYLFFKDERVIYSRFMPRLDLAKEMSFADVFVFPSLAEGSARVVSMAMACGCYIITTPNSGSPAIDGVNGSIVPPGDISLLEDAIRSAIKLSSENLDEVASKNINLIKENYTQKYYGEKLIALYSHLINI